MKTWNGEYYNMQKRAKQLLNSLEQLESIEDFKVWVAQRSNDDYIINAIVDNEKLPPREIVKLFKGEQVANEFAYHCLNTVRVDLERLISYC